MLQKGGELLKFYFVGFKDLENAKKALRNYDNLKDRKSLESVSLSEMQGNYLFINTSKESLIPPNELDNLLKYLETKIGVAVIIVGEDINSFSSKRKGTLHVEIGKGQQADKEVVKLIKKIRNALNRYAGNSAYTRKLKREIISFAFFDPNVLILGETGTGKTLLASIIHEVISRRKKFIALNSATIPVSLLESELFGHVKGAYTSADSTKEGLIAKAEGGHIFFDEIAELPLHIQAKLLHVVEEGTYNMVGDSTVRKADVRFLSATNREMNYLRKDLFFRISERVIRIPPLRQRKDDIPEIINFIFSSNGYALKFEDMSLEDQDKLLAYSYPGNIRELENIIKSYISESKIKLPSRLPEEKTTITFSKPKKVDSVVKGMIVDSISNLVDGVVKNGLILPYSALKQSVEEQFDIIYLTRILQMFKWDKHEVAERLSVSYRYLNKLISKYGLDRRIKKASK